MLTREQLAQLGEHLRGTSKQIGAAVEELEMGDDVDETRLEADLLEVDTELCVQCGWWHEVSELQYSEQEGGGLCEQCCDELGVEFQ
ncbi:hypothetical protein [Pseudomonas amygdali]|uniref:hypothetical protein n=1 Tax=Pseudomonas amygdali TaxID=47877 RepID=UPI000C3404E5|nr:hypothetical protein [Pseudomonas amygdali]PWD01979.1 hypothetical protein CX658_18660 [Pseudomonas amygdali pv. lachrymans]